MLIEEEPKSSGEINPDALEAVFEVDSIIEEDEVLLFNGEDDERPDEIDIAFQANDEDYW